MQGVFRQDGIGFGGKGYAAGLQKNAEFGNEQRRVSLCLYHPSQRRTNYVLFPQAQEDLLLTEAKP